MFKYHAFGLNILSEIELPGIFKALDDKVDVKISKCKITLPQVDKEIYHFVDKDDVYLWWDGIGKVKISNGKITVDLIDDKEDHIIPFLLGPVMALLLHQRGFLVLHGSAVKTNNGAIAFLGHRTFGKSTTAINLYKKGYPLITDDILAIKFDEKGLPIVYPGYHHIRLSNDSYNNVKDNTDILTPIRTIAGKAFCDASNGYSPEPLRLKVIYVLDKSDTIDISSLSSQKDLFDLLIHSVAHRVFKEKEQANNLLQIANLINNIPIHRLKIIHSYKYIPKVIETIEEDVDSLE